MFELNREYGIFKFVVIVPTLSIKAGTIDFLNSDMLLGCVYIPPENSKYSSEEAFIEVEDELLFFSRDHKNIALAEICKNMK
jgi:restriction endonuclease